jgi:hypothetical protein
MPVNVRILLLLAIWPFFCAQAQDTLASPRFVLWGSSSVMAADKAGRLYLVPPRNEILRYGPGGEGPVRFANNDLGPISWLDATDPLQLLVFSADFQQALTLDRTLNQTAMVALYDYGLVQVQAVCLSNRNTLWVFDPTDATLKNLGPGGGFLRQSADLRVAVDAAFNPAHLLEHDNFLLVQDTGRHVAVFDLSGNYLYALGFPTGVPMAVSEELLLLARENQLYGWNLRTRQQSEWPLPPYEGKLLQVSAGPGFLYLRTAEGVWGYTWP